jgi:hypothetical protein
VNHSSSLETTISGVKNSSANSICESQFTIQCDSVDIEMERFPMFWGWNTRVDEKVYKLNRRSMVR